MVQVNSSAILVEPIKNRKDAKLTRAYTTLMSSLHRAGIQPHKHILDNEISQAMKDLIQDKYHIQYKLVPPGCHRCNAAEVAICYFKCHFLSILAGGADNFPLQLWDKLLPQTEITLNLLRQSNVTSTISAYAHLCGPFDYNKMPLAPLGCNVQIHEKSDQCGTWAFHSVDGWYISTSPEHYRTYRCQFKSSNREQLSNTKHSTIVNSSNIPPFVRNGPSHQQMNVDTSPIGMGDRIKGTNNIWFIAKDDIPIECRKDITYGHFVCTVRPEKQEQNCTCFTDGGDRINYPSEVATPTAEMITAKILFNSVISTRFMTLDISNFYLMTPLKHPEYLQVKLHDIPDEIIHEYNLTSLANPDGSILMQLGMYGLPQAGLLANKLLEKCLNPHGYFQSKLVPGLWCHKQRPIQFSLVVDDFGIKYTGHEHANHLLVVLQEHYTVTADWTGKRYIGITLDWD
eukprot:CCRYP_013229-RA/>CCRYP_013229-RA protein AED:0.29 eAED:0.29 QI:0/0/0/1/0/0/2/0/456